MSLKDLAVSPLAVRSLTAAPAATVVADLGGACAASWSGRGDLAARVHRVAAFTRTGGGIGRRLGGPDRLDESKVDGEFGPDNSVQARGIVRGP
jgi:hypothetical protein